MPQASEGREILRHSVIGGLIAVALAWTDNAVHAWFREVYAHHPNWLQALTLAAVFVAAFGLIMSVERIWQTLDLKKRFKLPKLGAIDGIWVEATWDAAPPEPLDFAVLEISTANHEFAMSGTVFAAGSVRAGKLTRIGDCQSRGPLPIDDDAYYKSEGHNVPGQGSYRGVGLLRFYRQPGKPDLMFQGAYFGDGLERPMRHCLGRRFKPDGSLQSLGEGEILEYINALAQMLTPELFGRRPPARAERGRIDPAARPAFRRPL
ncbi:MAG TPA: hypothetical protein VHG32_12820 [Thermoanaerobaculia bacterium]|jgi:hypothetical protein|nr:hypothetical protein [Thermoanaerobaculia bacterium]